MRNGIGQGTVDITQGLVISWQVNGNSDITGWRVAIYKNDAASTFVYQTNVAIPFPFPYLPTDQYGNAKRQSVSINATTLSNAGMVNGEEYKIVITQYWQSYDGSDYHDETTVQSSPSVFITRATPTVTVAIDTSAQSYSPEQRKRNFTGYYTQAQQDALNWARWQIAVIEDGEPTNIIYDSGNIYGTPDLKAEYDGFLPDLTYGVKLTVQTQYGVEADSGWETFSVQYSQYTTGGFVNAVCVRNTNAVKVSWNAIGEIVGVANGSYSIADSFVTLPTSSSITWNTIGESQQMNFEVPWSVLLRCTLTTSDMTLFRLEQSSGAIELKYDFINHTITLAKGSTTLASQSGIINSPTVSVVLTATKLYIRSEYVGGGLYPSSILYPSTSLYPDVDDTDMVDTYELDVSYTQETITSVSVYGAGAIDYIEIKKSAPLPTVITAAITDGTYQPTTNNGCYLRAVFDENINAEILDIGNGTLYGYALYRQRSGENNLVHIADFTVSETELYDYSARSQQGDYTYYLFLLSGSNSYAADPIISPTINPCFWDWSLMECEETSDSNEYVVLNEYRFGKNLTSSDMSNNNQPNLMKNFTQYPTVQLVPQQYKSGTLTSLIGIVDTNSEYSDSIDLADKLYGLSLSTKPLFLKNRKGRLMRVNLSGAVSMKTSDNTREQAQTVTIPWVETASADGVSLYAFSNARQT